MSHSLIEGQTKRKNKNPMPQLDTVTFLSQVFWLIVFFFTFYLIVLKNILPSISRMIKARSKKNFYAQQLTKIFNQEQKKIVTKYEVNLVKSFEESTELLNRTESVAKNWVNNIKLKATTKSAASNLNNHYIKTVGEIKGKQSLIKNSVAACLYLFYFL